MDFVSAHKQINLKKFKKRLDTDVISWESNNPSDFVAFFGFLVTIRVFRGFDRLSSISGSKGMAK